jgi:hypothetical protein
MPAETHQQRDAVTVDEIVDFLLATLASSMHVADVDADTALVDLGVDSDLALFDLFDLAAEEYGERSLGELDLDDLWSAPTIGAVARLLAQHWARSVEDAGPAERGDS